ncbi:hypothetical protein NPIL_93071, partial [Nephila pilipes]
MWTPFVRSAAPYDTKSDKLGSSFISASTLPLRVTAK